MANFVLPAGLSITKWTNTFVTEFVRENPYYNYMGNGSKNVIHVNRDLSKGAGERIRFAYAKKLRGAVITGGAVLRGNEDQLETGYDEVRVRLQRFGVRFTEDQTFPTDLPLMNQAKDSLQEKASDDIAVDVGIELNAVIVAGVGGAADISVPLDDATPAQVTAWETANADRILTGFTTLSADAVRAAKSMALRTALGNSYAITPLKSDAAKSRDMFVIFAGLDDFEAFAADPEVKSANENARPREVESNPLFMGGDQYLDGVIVHLDPRIPAGRPVLCGQNAVLCAWGKPTTMIKDQTDYGHSIGIGYSEIRGLKKASLEGVQVGIVNIILD